MAHGLVLLHGFSGTHRAWDGVIGHLDPQRYTPVALDLPGHGEQARGGEPLSFAGCVEHVLARAPQRFTLAGYSMGARIALHVALAAPERVQRLVLIGANPGIEDAAERARRRAADERLAQDLERIPFEQFIERWRAQPLFAGEPEHASALARADHLRNDPHALAAVLRGIGVGEMAPLWGRLGELSMPVQVVVGERDEKYRGLGLRMLKLLAHGDLISPAGGHGLLLENPQGVATVIEEGREVLGKITLVRR